MVFNRDMKSKQQISPYTNEIGTIRKEQKHCWCGCEKKRNPPSL